MIGKRIATILFVLGFAAQADGGLFITEFKAVNNGTLVDEDGNWSDWIEVFNSGPGTINLNGWFLTDDRNNLPNWSFPSTNLVAGRFLVVFASGKDRRVPGRELHTSFNLKALGEYLALVEPDGLTVTQEFAPAYPEQTSSFAYGFSMDGTIVHAEAPSYLRETPGRANPSAGAAIPLALTEVMYNPAPASTNVGAVGYPYSFIELKNLGTNALNLDGVHFGSGIGYTFTNYLLAGGARVLVVYNKGAFEFRYGTGLPVAGEFTGTLSGSGEQLALFGSNGATIFNFVYDQNWHRITDGHGFSLVPVNENGPASTYGQASSWRASGQRHGSPGRLDPPSTIPPVYINEVLTRSAAPYEDALELFNPGTNDVDIGGWYLTDDFDLPFRFKMPYGAVVPAGGFLAMDEHTFNSDNDDPLAEGFGLGDFGEEIYLFSGAANGELSGFVHGFKFGTAETNVTFGRYITSTGEEQFVPQSAITFLETNAGPKVGPIVISEIHYHPPNISGSDNKLDEFIELRNLSDVPVPLYDVLAPSNTWQLFEAELHGMSFVFPTGVVVAAHGHILVTSLTTNSFWLPAFRETNHVAPGTPIFGPWFGSLANGSGRLELMRPDSPELLFVPYIVMDRVAYKDSLPWPLGADGAGASLQRIDSFAYGNDPANWRAALPSPGFVGGVPPVVATQPADQIVAVGANVLLGVAVAGDGPFTYQWRFNGANLPGATEETLQLSNVGLAESGGYACLVWGKAGFVLSRIATVQVIDGLPPMLDVTWPATPILRVTTPLFIPTGKATDNVQVAAVLLQNGTGPFVPVEGTTNWHGSVNLKAGFNTLRFVAVDSYGNMSPTNTSVVLLQPDTARLGLFIRGIGSVSGASNGRQLKTGRSYQLTATPAAGHVFSNWVDSAGNAISTNRTLTIVMQPGLTLAANFAPGPFLEVKGAYDGLFYTSENPGHTNAGFFSLNVTAGGAYSGKLFSRGKTYTLHGVFRSDLVVTQVIHRAASNDLTVSMHLLGVSMTVTGTVSEVNFISGMDGHRSGFSSKQIGTNFAGRYSCGLGAAANASETTGTLTVNSLGRMALSGRLPGGTKVSRGFLAGDDGLAPLYLPLYNYRGSAFGWLSLTNSVPESLNGSLYWIRTKPPEFNDVLTLHGRR